MSKHSPGPWRWREVDGEDWDQVLEDANEDLVFDGGPIVFHSDHDARLIAAAPEMLELLKWARERTLAGRDITREWEDEYDALLARIDGNSQ